MKISGTFFSKNGVFELHSNHIFISNYPNTKKDMYLIKNTDDRDKIHIHESDREHIVSILKNFDGILDPCITYLDSNSPHTYDIGHYDECNYNESYEEKEENEESWMNTIYMAINDKMNSSIILNLFNIFLTSVVLFNVNGNTSLLLYPKLN